MSAVSYRILLGFVVIALALGVPGAARAQSATVAVTQHPTLGAILTDGAGRTLYRFTRDSAGVSNCTGECAALWPPLLTEGSPAAGAGLDGALLGVITRPDSGRQVTYDGQPLYYFAQDTAPGDTKGQGVRDVWFGVNPAAASAAPAPAPAQPPAPAPAPQQPPASLPTTGAADPPLALAALIALALVAGGLALRRTRRS